MRRAFFALLLSGMTGFFYIGCDVAEVPVGNAITLSGRVVNMETAAPIQGALVFLRDIASNKIIADGTTDGQGKYNFETAADSTIDLRVVVRQNGFSDAVTEVLAKPGDEISVPLIQMEPLAQAEPESGPASNIILQGDPPQSIGVKGSGSPEVAEVRFLVADSLGRPVTLDHAVNVRFRIGAGPGGGEFIFPETASTTNNGIVTANISSGTAAGVVQIIAEATAPGGTIRSTPVALTIHGGLPDAEHFSLGPAQINFPGLLTYGLTNGISVIVGDKYSNPVKPGTAVYFKTSHGLIGGSTVTNGDGGGSVNLMSADPLPYATKGIAVVTATTIDENQATIEESRAIVFSGSPELQLALTASDATSRSYKLTVTDLYKNPLAMGTSIGIEAEGENVKTVGSTQVTLSDTELRDGVRDANGNPRTTPVPDGDLLDYEDVLVGPGITTFGFTALAEDDSSAWAVKTITVTIAGPNGDRVIPFDPNGFVMGRVEGIAVEQQPDGSPLIRFTD